MKKRFTEEQIIGFLREVEAGVAVKDLCRRKGFSPASFYQWRAKFGGMSVSEAKRLKALEAENGRLKKLVAELMLETRWCVKLSKKSGESASSPRAGSLDELEGSLGACGSEGDRDERERTALSTSRRSQRRAAGKDPVFGAAASSLRRRDDLPQAATGRARRELQARGEAVSRAEAASAAQEAQEGTERRASTARRASDFLDQ